MIKKSLMALVAVTLLAACQPQKVDEKQLEEAVAKYIKENPDKVLDSLRAAAQARMQQGMGRPGGPGQPGGPQMGQPQQPPQPTPEQEKAAIQKVLPKLLDASHHATIGDKNSKNVVVEFYDYNCGFCKRALDTVKKLANEEKAHVVLVELPVLGPTSESAARASAVVNSLAPNKFWEFHSALLTGEGHVDDAKIESAVKAAGIDLAKFKAELGKDKYTQILQENRAAANALGIRGTPSFIVNEQLIRGAQPYENFKAALKK